MITLTMSEEEAKTLRNVLDNYHSHLELEIVRTRRKEFRNALKEKEKLLLEVIHRLNHLLNKGL